MALIDEILGILHPKALEVFVLATWIGALLGMSTRIALAFKPNKSAWYNALQKPWFTPPRALFPPVWTTLYVLMGWSSWRVWREDRHRSLGYLNLIPFAIQLGFNFAWVPLFFGFHSLGLAVLDIVSLCVALTTTVVVFSTVDTVATLMLLPYLAWIVYATGVAYALWQLNKKKQT